MSWSHEETGPASKVARSLEISSEEIQRYLRPNNQVECALHARAVCMLIAACCESNETAHVKIVASGSFDGKHHHFSVVFDGIDAPEGDTTPDIEPTPPKPYRRRSPFVPKQPPNMVD